MRKRFFLFVFFFLSLIAWGGQKIKIFKELVFPYSMDVREGVIAISDKTGCYVYSIKGFKFEFRVSKRGEGPGEFRYPPYVTVKNKKLYLNNSRKLSVFDFKGKMIKEIRFPFIAMGKVIPIKNKAYIVVTRENKNGMIYRNLNYYDEKFKKVKTLYTDKLENPLKRIESVNYIIKYDFENNEIYVAEGRLGFYIKVFDEDGNFIRSIKKEYEKIPVQEWYKRKIIEEFKRQPQIKPFWNEFKKRIFFPDSFPAMVNFLVDKEKLYIKTYKKKGNNFEFVNLSRKGKLLRKIFLKEANVYSINNGKYYYFSVDEKGNYKLAIIKI